MVGELLYAHFVFMLLLEYWKPSYYCPYLYEVSFSGKVRNVNTKVFKLYHPDRHGYPTVNLDRKFNPKKIRVHRLVALTFIPNPENKPEVNHIDGVKTNACASNLEWNTQAENREHAYRIGLMKRKKQLQTIKVFDTSGKIVVDINNGVFYTVPEICKTLNATRKQVCRMLSGERYNKTSYRYALKDKILDNARLPPIVIKKEPPPKIIRIPKPKIIRKPIKRYGFTMYDLSGNIVMNFKSGHAVSKHFGVSSSTFLKQIKESKRGYYKGYLFRETVHAQVLQ